MENSRAVQFTPFAALRGYYEMIREKERVRVPHHHFAEDTAELLSRKMQKVARGKMLSVVHYNCGEYIKTTGLVSKIDPSARILTIVKLPISFDDIYDVEGEEISEE